MFGILFKLMADLLRLSPQPSWKLGRTSPPECPLCWGAGRLSVWCGISKSDATITCKVCGGAGVVPAAILARATVGQVLAPNCQRGVSEN